MKNVAPEIEVNTDLIVEIEVTDSASESIWAMRMVATRAVWTPIGWRVYRQLGIPVGVYKTGTK